MANGPDDLRNDIERWRSRYVYAEDATLLVVRKGIPQVFKELGITQRTVVEVMGDPLPDKGVPPAWKNRITNAGQVLPSGEVRRGISFAEAWGLIYAFDLDPSAFDPDLPGY